MPNGTGSAGEACTDRTESARIPAVPPPEVLRRTTSRCARPPRGRPHLATIPERRRHVAVIGRHAGDMTWTLGRVCSPDWASGVHVRVSGGS